MIKKTCLPTPICRPVMQEEGKGSLQTSKNLLWGTSNSKPPRNSSLVLSMLFKKGITNGGERGDSINHARKLSGVKKPLTLYYMHKRCRMDQRSIKIPGMWKQGEIIVEYLTELRVGKNLLSIRAKERKRFTKESIWFNWLKYWKLYVKICIWIDQEI